MATESLPYDKWIEEALRDVVRRAMVVTAKHGLPADHHFFVTFRTDADDVSLPSHLRAQHPSEMTIVLQHQFWDLKVEADAFSVTLKFRGKRERLLVPFARVTAFADPSVNFGLQLKAMHAPQEAPTKGLMTIAATEDAADGNESAAGVVQQTPAGKVIALDSFRKK